MKKYEAVFILNTRKNTDDGKTFMAELEELIKSQGGEMLEVVAMGRKQFAREITKIKAGMYWNFSFNINPDSVESIRDKYRLDERVIRMLIMNYDRPTESIKPDSE